MKVRDLIQKLSEHDLELEVTVDGYEGGVTSNITLEEIQVHMNVNTEWYYGKHELVAEYNETGNLEGSIKVLNLNR
jgi:hypothetical protein